MAFIRRKSGVYHDDVYCEDFEPQRRRRLSKPNTKSIKDFSSPSLLSMKASTNTANVLSYTDAPPSKIHSTSSAVALLAARFEKAPNAVISQVSFSSTKPTTEPGQRGSGSPATSKSHKSSLASLVSKEQQRSEDSPSVTPATSSLEQIVEACAPPPRRTASFMPGMATRLTSYEQEKISVAKTSMPNKRKSRDSNGSTMALTEAQLLETWKPPPQENRPVTPLNLEYGSILGSLRVANGAASPVSSSVLKSDAPLVTTTLRRDTSSVYPESEIGTLRSKRNDSRQGSHTRMILSSSNPTRVDLQRAFSFNPGTEQCFNEHGAGLISKPETAPMEDSQANQMAEDYIAELARSPFASPSPPDSPRFRTHDLVTEDQSSFVDETPEAIGQLDNDVVASDLAQSQGSVRRFPVRSARRSFVDDLEEVDRSIDHPDSELPAQVPERHDSPASFFTMFDSNDDKQEQFSSALELQASRSISPAKSPLRQVVNGEDMRHSRPSKKPSDSGYSSSESLGMSSQHQIVDSSRASQHESRLLIRKPLRTPFQPILVHQEVAKTLPAPTVATIEVPTASTSSTSLQNQAFPLDRTSSPTKKPLSLHDPKEKGRNKLKKLQRKPAKTKAAQPVVQRLASVESFSVPPVSSAARTNLALRAQLFPELNRTFKTQEDTGRNPNASSLSLVSQPQPLHFPSPEPKTEPQRTGRTKEKSRSRRRSLSRPRSWFGWSKEEKQEQRSGTTEPLTASSLADLGDVVDALGSNPYDIAQRDAGSANILSRNDDDKRAVLQQRRTTPSNISINASLAKPMMDDAAASKFSELRRLSRSEPKSPSTTTFNDRGGIPGRLPHAARPSIDAPPLPPMPTHEEINKRLSLRLGNVAAPDIDTFEPSPGLTDPPDEDEEPPLPPPHSPRPSYIEEPSGEPYGYFSKSSRSATESQLPEPSIPAWAHDHVEEEGMVPIPPPHSPSPQILDRDGRSREVSWTDQADAWRERARSASANLRHSWHEREAGPSREPWSYEHFHVDPYVQRDVFPRHARGHDHYSPEYEMYHGQAHVEFQHDHDFQEFHPDQPEFYHQQHYRPTSQPHQNYRLPHAATWSADDGLNQAYGDYNHRHQTHEAEYQQRRPYAPEQRHSFHAARSEWAETISTHRYRPQSRHSSSRPSSRHRQSRPSSRHSGMSRPTSRHSHASRKSLAHELHPDHEENHHRRRSNIDHIPQLGRYSGGLDFTFHSSGARSVSTAKKPARQRNSWLDMESYGLDMNDVPAMQVPVGVDGSRMIYR